MGKNKINITFSIVRVFAIISIACAHINIPQPVWVAKMMSTFGSVGVTIFIILSGYFYHSDKYKNILQMLSSKVKSIFIPWAVFGSLFYLWGAIVGGNGINPVLWITYILGYKTFFYYLSVLVLCYLIFFKRNKIVMYFMMCLNVISVYLTAMGLLDGIIQSLHITNYLNIFNWAGYFAIGYLLQEVKGEQIIDLLRRTMFFSTTISLVLYILICTFNIQNGYFSFIGMPYQLVTAMALMGISTYNIFDKSIVHKMSNLTFGVYLIHMFVVSIGIKLCGFSIPTKLSTPIVVVAICMLVLEIGHFISKKIHLEKLYCTLTGVRLDRNFKK